MNFQRLKNGKIKKSDIANKANLSQAFFSQILNGERAPSWNNAKKLFEITGIEPEFWLDTKNNNQPLQQKIKELTEK